MTMWVLQERLRGLCGVAQVAEGRPLGKKCLIISQLCQFNTWSPYPGTGTDVTLLASPHPAKS